ncbi:uncharacterized protein EDB91DRAFT_1256776 [Suillus paluster]|uniref:uncharacterized protein n=1 Tax=Suillus paluster TaxID=48578 RepID=UPI001B86C1E6|nr:uncharacterized protein EDB91DRAFT_1256776 [Suillus paluster]KAG1720912.1 hypothetical protein EDB91DRAFT_1256776 [Suillus paluster]
MQSLTGSLFGFCASNNRDVIRCNHDHTKNLKEGSLFAYQDWESKHGIYKTDLLQMGANHMWFANHNDEDVIHHEYFNPFPVETMTLMLTAIKCCIDEWITGVKEDIKF